jgi:hypothetical protein
MHDKVAAFQARAVPNLKASSSFSIQASPLGGHPARSLSGVTLFAAEIGCLRTLRLPAGWHLAIWPFLGTAGPCTCHMQLPDLAAACCPDLVQQNRLYM